MIEKFNVTITPYQLERMIHVYLPNDYYNSDEHYPVVYMYDGHNLFNDEDATYGKSWGLKDFLDQYDKKLIIVGIECNHEGKKRLDEFCPYHLPQSFLGHIHGKGKELMEWVVRELKPMIDTRYRTYPFRECTAIGGSSMGGLMSLYSVIKYNNIFSKAACVSPSYNLCLPRLKKDMQVATISPDTRVYLSFGTNEIRNLDHKKQTLKSFVDYFNSKHAFSYINIVSGGEHNEASWEKENPIYMDFLWK